MWIRYTSLGFSVNSSPYSSTDGLSRISHQFFFVILFLSTSFSSSYKMPSWFTTAHLNVYYYAFGYMVIENICDFFSYMISWCLICLQWPWRTTFPVVCLFFVCCSQVKDQEFPYRKSLARVLIEVEDINDHVPLFTSSLYEASVYESATVGSAVVQVTALDKDKGKNAKLHYSIEEGRHLWLQLLSDAEIVFFIEGMHLA